MKRILKEEYMEQFISALLCLLMLSTIKGYLVGGDTARKCVAVSQQEPPNHYRPG